MYELSQNKSHVTVLVRSAKRAGQADDVGLKTAIGGVLSCSHFHGRAAAVIAAALRPRTSAAGLTVREREVIRLVGDGLSNKQIASRLGITERTAKFHVRQIRSKLGADNRAHAVALAARRHYDYASPPTEMALSN